MAEDILDYEPPGRKPFRYEIRKGREERARRGFRDLESPETSPLEDIQNWWVNLTPEERVGEVFGNLLPGPKAETLALGAFGGLTRTETYRQLAKGLKLQNLIPKEELIQRVRGALKGATKLADEELAPINSIAWEPNLDALMNRAPGEGPYGVARAGDIVLNPTKGAERKHTWTFMEEALHANQWEDTDLWLLMQKGSKWLKNLGKRSQGLIDRETQYIYDPGEVHAKYQVNRRLRDYPEEMAPELMRDTYYNAGVEQIARKAIEFGESYPKFAPEAKYEAMAYRSYLSDLLKGSK